MALTDTESLSEPENGDNHRETHNARAVGDIDRHVAGHSSISNAAAQEMDARTSFASGEEYHEATVHNAHDNADISSTFNQKASSNEENEASVSGVADVVVDLSLDPYQASPNSKYERYEVRVAHEEGDRGLEIKLLSWKRPHMRSFHCAWMSFFLAFTIWVTPAPLLKEIASTLQLTKQQVWTSSITNDVTAILMRILIGPICDAHGARIPMAAVLVAASIPTAMLGLVNSATGLIVIRFFIGIAGASFVMSQSWPSRMFSREIAGTVNGMIGGWGNLGGAFAQLLMGFVLFPLFRDSVYQGNVSKSWRTISVIPAGMALIWGSVVAFISDDAPMGNYAEMKRMGTMDRVYYTTSLRSGAKMNTWLLFVQYACCFGVEIAMNNAAVLYFTSEFGLTTEAASVLGFSYGSMNLFARGLGGFASDRLNLWSGLRGRLWLCCSLLVCEGVLIIVFSYTTTLGGAIATMCLFSIFTQSAEGAIFGVVPYVSKLYTGSVSGLVGSGGNLGSIVYGFLFRSLSYRTGFAIMGGIVTASSLLSALIRVPCHAHMLSGEDNHSVIKARERFLHRKELERRQALEQQPQQQQPLEPQQQSEQLQESPHSEIPL